MSMKIRQNPSALNTLRHASDHFSKVKGGIERLSSGVKINRGADGPATLIASEKLRGNIVGLQQVFENVSSSVSMLQTAEGALNEVSDLLIKKTLELNGTITGEHGIGLHKKDYLLKEHGDNIPVMKSIKRTLDPNNIMNPGKIFDLN